MYVKILVMINCISGRNLKCYVYIKMLGSKGILPHDAMDCFEFHVTAILKHEKSVLIRLLFHVFTGHINNLRKEYDYSCVVNIY